MLQTTVNEFAVGHVFARVLSNQLTRASGAEFSDSAFRCERSNEGENPMKQMFAMTLAAIAVTAAVAQPAPSYAPPQQSYSDTAQVLSAQPIYERNNVPRQECANETVTETRTVPSQGYVTANYAPGQPAPAPAPTGERTVGAGTIIGAIIGGVVGHQFGNSSGGRDRGTAAGAIVGGLVGNQIENSAPSTASAQSASGPARVDYVPETRTVQRCRTVYDGRDEIVGYNVAYRYQGRDYTTRMAYDPGPTMNVRVNLAPDVPPPVRRP